MRNREQTVVHFAGGGGSCTGEALKARLHEVGHNKSLRWRRLNARTWGHGTYTT